MAPLLLLNSSDHTLVYSAYVSQYGNNQSTCGTSTVYCSTSSHLHKVPWRGPDVQLDEEEVINGSIVANKQLRACSYL